MSSDAGTPPIRTIGHGTLAARDFGELVASMAVDVVVDIRRFPGSRRFPHFGEAQLAAWLPEHGVAYHRLSALGGRRKPAPDSPHVALRNEQFRAYADHMATREFRDGIAELTALADGQIVALMCAESVWWRCHRRLVADHLVVVEQLPVEHGFHDGRLQAHQPLAEVRRVGDDLVYDVAAA